MMSERITITCTACSATLAAPESAAGKTLLCPKCRTGIPVPPPERTALTAITEQATAELHSKQRRLTGGAAASRRQMWNDRKTLLKRLALGVAVPLTLALIFLATEHFQRLPPKVIGPTATQKGDGPVDHVETLIGRVQQQLKLPQTNVEGAVRDLEHLKRLVPQHPIHREILPALSIARSMEHAEVGRIAAAIQELENAVTLGAAESQLVNVKQSLTTALLGQAELNLQNQLYHQVLTDCNEILKLDGTMLRVAPLAGKASTALVAQASTAEELDRVIRALEILTKSRDSAGLAENMRKLYLRRSRLAIAGKDLDTAASQFLKMSGAGPLDADGLKLGETLARKTIAAFEATPSDQNRRRAFLIVEQLDDAGLDSTKFVQEKLALAGVLLAHDDPENRDSHLSFSIQNINLARSMGIEIDEHPRLVPTLALALEDRCLERLRQDRVHEGLEDFRTAIALDPELTRHLLARLRRATLTTRELLPPDLLDQLIKGEQDDILIAIPAQAIAFSVIRDMDSYSGKIDRLTTSMGFPPLELLDTYCDWCRIHGGLNRNGSLGWVKMPETVGGQANKGKLQDLFLLATTDFLRMIPRLDPRPDRNLYRVTMIDGDQVERKGLASPLGSYGAFAFANDRATLITALDGDDIRTKMVPFDGWAADLDAYFVLTHQGLISGLKEFDLPFPNPLLKKLLSLIYESTSGSATRVAEKYPSLHEWVQQLASGHNPPPLHEWIQQLAVGLTIDPGYGIAVRSRLWLNKEINLAEVFSENPGGRELALKHLPDAPFVFAFGGPVSASQSMWISALPEQLVPLQKNLDLHISHVQAVLLVPEPVPAVAEDRQRKKAEAANQPGLAGGLILVVTVQDSETALAELENMFAALGEPAAERAGNAQPVRPVVSSEIGKLDDVTVLRVRQTEGQRIEMRIAAPDRETLVFAVGGDEQLVRALSPFRGNANLSQSGTVRAAVRMLPDSTSWVAVADLQSALPLALEFTLDPGSWDRHRSEALVRIMGDSPIPLALGLSWQESDLDMDLSVPWERFQLGGWMLWFLWLQNVL